jgi:hypothetical protein
MNRQGFERKQLWPDRGIILAFVWKTTKTSLRIALHQHAWFQSFMDSGFKCSVSDQSNDPRKSEDM